MTNLSANLENKMSDEQVKEFVMPVISLTPMAPPIGSPVGEPVADPTPVPTSTVEFHSCTYIMVQDGQTLFDLTFIVRTSDSAEPNGMVVRRIAINNAAFATEAGKTPTFYIEAAEAVEDKKDAGAATAKRLRELAGIPHRGNFV